MSQNYKIVERKPFDSSKGWKPRIYWCNVHHRWRIRNNYSLYALHQQPTKGLLMKAKEFVMLKNLKDARQGKGRNGQ